MRRRSSPTFAASAIALTAGVIALPARADEAACIAASEQALSLRQQGKLHDALTQLAICAEASCSAEVKAECTARIGAIDAAMPTLVLVAKDGTGNDLSDVRVTMDAAPLAARLDGRPLAIDPGEHSFTFETPGAAPVEKKLVLREGERDRLETITIGAPPPASSPPVASPASSAPHGVWGTQKTLAVVSGGVGVIGVGLGIWFGAFAASSQSKEQRDCSAAACTNLPQAVEDYNTAKQDALASTIALVVGAAMLATGGALWFTAPPDHRPADGAWRLRLAPVIDGSSGRLLVGSRF
jgi:hypothetical protein